MANPSVSEANDGYPAFGLDTLRQGDVVEVPSIPVQSGLDNCDWIATPDGIVVISQTCDLVRPKPRYVAVAPLLQLPEEEAGPARKGKQPSLVPVRARGQLWFADLRHITSVSKEFLAYRVRTHGLVKEDDISEFGKLVGRKFSRFAFPDDIVYWLQPLENVVRSKYSNQNSSEGKLFEEVSEFRIEVTTPWEQPPCGLTLVTILKAGSLDPFSREDFPDLPPALSDWLRPNRSLRPTDQLVERLEATKNPVERYWLWQALGESWAGKCRPKAKDLNGLREDERERVNSAVLDGEVASDVTTEDDFSMHRYIHSEMLDLDHLSPSRSLVSGMDGGELVRGPLESKPSVEAIRQLETVHNKTPLRQFYRRLFRHPGRPS